MNNEPNISLYGDGSGEDFPVLKAFQQYIDAEQAKARKRLLTVSVIFVVMLIAVIAIFSALVIKANNQTQTLNDRLVEFAMKDKDRSVEEAKSAAIQEATVKSLNETLLKLQKQIEEQERTTARAAANAARELTTAKREVESPSFFPAQDKRQQEAEAKIQKALAQLKAEKEKLAGEKEKLRQEELERYRREHYPEYYAKKEAAERARKRQLQEDLDEIDEEIGDDDAVTYFDDEPTRPRSLPAVKSPSKKQAVKKPAKRDIDLDDEEGAIEYFKDTDTYTIPVEVKGKRAGWRVPLD